MIAESIFATSVAAIAYHHLAYPAILKLAAGRKKRAPDVEDAQYRPHVTIIMPACNEEAHIAAKIRNLAKLTYPADRLHVVILCDGCSDRTAEIAQRVMQEKLEARVQTTLVVHAVNRGKVAVLNEAIAEVGVGLVVLTDVSAELEPDAIERGVAHFARPNVGVVCGTYKLDSAASTGESGYWAYQVAIKTGEAAIASPIGAHGAFYMVRRDLWTPLEPDTINDDVILPMRIVTQGFDAIYDPEIAVTERAPSSVTEDFRRRMRIGAGNLQQLLRLPQLANPSRPGLAFVFLSGKALRVTMPLFMLAALFANVALASTSSFYTWLLAGQLLGYAAALTGVALDARRPRLLVWMGYLVFGHAASFVGALRYLVGVGRKPWTRREVTAEAFNDAEFLDPAVRFGKRALDIVIAAFTLVIFAVLIGPLAIIMKLDSRGPIFYRQLRVGLRTPSATHFFYLIKLRSMRTDAETKSGAVWASADDPRITRIGRFLRKTRLDELPQCLNVLAGDMSIVGPRPERPQFFTELEHAIPYYVERTYGLKPGITGLAQVSQGYDESIEDVRSKVMFDHAYALSINAPLRWFYTDISIICRTFIVMITGRGQ